VPEYQREHVFPHLEGKLVALRNAPDVDFCSRRRGFERLLSSSAQGASEPRGRVAVPMEAGQHRDGQVASIPLVPEVLVVVARPRQLYVMGCVSV